MFQHILVPLDGSQTAERALPVAAFLAGKLGAHVTLLHLIERRAPETVHGERHLTDPSEARVYLEKVRQEYLPASLQVRFHVHDEQVGDVARGIVEHTGEFNPDLIVMCAHGEHQTRDRIFGSMAQKVLGKGSVPVLVIKPSAGASTGDFKCRTILVPLDGRVAHEEGLEVAARLAEKCGATLHLVTVVHTLKSLTGPDLATGRLTPRATTEILDQEQETAIEYLKQRTKGMEGRVETEAGVGRGDPAELIAQTADRTGADLIVLGTHGRSGFEAFWSGSVAARVHIWSHVPVLLVPVGQQGSPPDEEKLS